MWIVLPVRSAAFQYASATRLVVQVRVKLAENHRQVFRSAEARVTALAIEHDADLRRRLTKEQGVWHSERIADRVAQQANGLIQVVQDDGGGELDDPMPRATVAEQFTVDKMPT